MAVGANDARDHAGGKNCRNETFARSPEKVRPRCAGGSVTVMVCGVEPIFSQLVVLNAVKVSVFTGLPVPP
jgi:hypothetical protein